MKLTKKLETEIRKVYHTYWQSYSTGDVKTFAGILDKTFEMIGTSESEVCHTKEDGIKFLKAQIKELVGKVEMRNRRVSVVPVNEHALVNEQCDIYILTGKRWNFYSKFRASTFLRNTSSGWKVFQQHGSLPDMRVQEGETMAFEKISKENLQLREAVQRRTIELESKSRELEIEAALERVRSVAMGMKMPEDMLIICKIISKQLALLGVKDIRNVQTAIFYPDRGIYMNYQYYAKHDRTFITETDYTDHKIPRAFAAKMQKGKGQLSVTHIKGRHQLKEWVAYQKGTNVFIDKYLNTADYLGYYWYSLGPVALGISTYRVLTEDETSLFKRFRNVFELSYRRFMDIQKAEAQAREAQIEAALERIRAASLAMRDSTALSGIINKLYGELTKLDARLDRCFIMIVNPVNNGITWWLAGKEGLLAKNGFFVQMNQHPTHLMYLDNWKKRKKKWRYLFEGKEKRDWDRFGFHQTELARLPEFIKKDMAGIKRIYLSGSSDQFGSLVTGSLVPLPEEQQEILSRFTTVFNQAYIRFLDLQKAEARARQAQIEVAVEKVRAKALAMHQSEEILGLVHTLWSEIKALNIPGVLAAAIYLRNEDNSVRLWDITSTHELKGGFRLETDIIFRLGETDPELWISKIWKAKNKYSVVEEKDFVKVYEWVKKNIGRETALAGRKIFRNNKIDKMWVPAVRLEHGRLTCDFIQPPPAEMESILLKMGKAFDLAYKRFLDLKKSEAQAREAQIEVALERIRARALAMHTSEELLEVAGVLWQQMGLLGQPELESSIVHLYNEDPETFSAWYAYSPAGGNPGKKITGFARPSKSSSEWAREVMRNYNSPQTEYTIISRGKKLKEWYRVLAKLAPETVEYDAEGQLLVPPVLYHHFSKFSGGALLIISNQEPSGETRELLKRAAAVFELAYTRFLDLQKAEAQAKEAQIEAALERVRSRTMAMHKSEELLEVISTVSEQLEHLQFRFHSVSFVINNKDYDLDYWLASPGQSHPFRIHVPYLDNPIITRFRDARNKGVSFFADILTGKENLQWTQHMLKNSILKNISDKDRQYLMSRKGLARSVVITNHISLAIVNYAPAPYPEEQNAIFKRFGNVFEQSYTRFLDLQKAEAQAKEAQIETALEKVRSRSLAVHYSHEFNEVIKVVFERLQELEIPMTSASINVFIKGSKDTEVYLCGAGDDGLVLSQFRLVHFDHPIANDRYDAYEKGMAFFTKTYGREEKNSFYAYQFDVSDLKNIPADIKRMVMESESYTISMAPAKNSMIVVNDFEGKSLSAKQTDIIKRFAKVFEQAYVRFLDLQKAEAQAREAQIEAALERIRARAMAMRQSDELDEVLVVLWEQFDVLGIRPMSAHMTVVDIPNNRFTFRETGKSGNRSFGEQVVNIDAMDIWKEAAEQWRRSEPETLNRLHFPKESLPMVWQVFHQSFSSMPADSRITPDDYPDGIYHIAGKHPFGYIGINQIREATEEEERIVIRFASEFGRAYQRFLDLQKAEAQAREAQIEAALERVRSKTMAMHNSTDVGETAAVMVEELKKLGIDTMRCGIGIMHEPGDMEVWTISTHENNKTDIVIGWLDMHIHPLLHGAFESWRNKNESYSYELKGDDLLTYYNAINNYPGYPIRYDTTDLPKQIHHNEFAFPEGILFAFSLQQLTEENRKIFKRVAAVFGQTYRRYLDLQRTEAQARESQIQLALERVRARTMAMQKSDELSEAVFILFNQFKELGEKPDQATIGIINEKEWVIEYWVTMYGNQMDKVFKFSIDEPHVTDRIYKAWKEEKKSLVIDLSGKELYEFSHYREKMGGARYNPDEKHRFFNVAFFSKGLLIVQSNEARSEESIHLLERFAVVFEQTYTRFLDLQKAEAQAREAQIETSLERVRARTMAMHSSEDVTEATVTMFTELEKLGIQNKRCGIASFNLNRTMEVWSVSNVAEGKKVTGAGMFDIDSIPLWKHLYSGWEKKDDFFHYRMQGEEKEDYFKIISAAPNYLSQGIQGFPDMSFQSYYFNEGSVWTFSLVPHSDEDKQLMKRFASVFSLTFRRYQDLKKAEEQAREAQIEAALERVRSRTMAMHKSDELPETSHILFEQLKELGEPVEQLTIGIVNEENNVVEISATLLGDTLKKIYNHSIDEPYMMTKVYKAWKKQQKTLVVELRGDELNAYNQYRNELTNSKIFPTNLGEEQQRIVYAAFFSKGMLAIGANEKRPPESLQLLVKFASVFDLTYTRFLDLQKAEAQAREAQIEAALERVRGKAMAMHNSNDLIATAGVLFTEMRKMGINTFRSGVGLFTKENRKVKLYSAATTGKTDNLPVVGSALLDGHEVLSEMYERWLRNEDYFPLLKGELLKTYYQKINSSFTVPVEQTEHYEQHGYFLSFSEGMFYGWSEKPYTDDEIKFLQRLKVIVALTFRRYMELQRAEANALDALRSASLDRVRAEIASMRTPSDLEKITPLIWKELTVLNIPFVRCGVFIMDEGAQLIHTFLSTPDGKAIAAFHLPYQSTPLSDSIAYWRVKEMYQIHWDKHTFSDLADSILAQGIELDKTQYLSSVPAEGIHLHLLPFLQGMFYVGNTAPLDADSLGLIQSVANAFSTAYARYEDFIKLEEARRQTENALLDLQAAQKQLIQSEKMASLGELTAGIAHEIQNPLNFVNNFSEVSKELLDEMRETIEKGDSEQAKEIMNDVIQNLEKINHHGKRADGIVKGMLQHSRAGSGQKELTDINALCDEYLRLAYHGLRAKDKSFNAKFETDFDESVAKIEIMPQEIGRVILNLINNAFYAATEKKKQGIVGYEPTVKVSTQRNGDMISISVKDNGNGISQKVLDKIFQPFFTTKPTGQGTGLGLSLSYDIVKAHGGEIKVETKEGEGTTFSIVLSQVN